MNHSASKPDDQEEACHFHSLKNLSLSRFTQEEIDILKWVHIYKRNLINT